MNPKLSADAANREMVREIAGLLRSFDSVESMKRWPPKPGFTDISRMMSRRSITWSR